MDKVIADLGRLGFAPLEAKVYLGLLPQGALTGYAIAKCIGCNKANTYKALEALALRGAVVRTDQAPVSLWRAVPHRELMASLERKWNKAKNDAALYMDRIASQDLDHQVYVLAEVDAVISKAKAMIAQASELILVDSFPQPLAALTASLVDAVKPDLRIAVRHYSNVELKGVRTYLSENADTILKGWRGQWLCLSVDASQCLIAHFSRDMTQLDQAIWSRSPLLAMIIANGMGAEMVMGHLVKSMAENPAADGLIERVIADYETFCARGTSGQRTLLERKI